MAGTIAVLNLKLAWDEIGGWVQGAGHWAWLVWATALPLSAGLIALLLYVTVVPAVQRLKGVPVPLSQGVHGPSAMPPVKPPRPPRSLAVALDFSAADPAVLSYAVTVARTIGKGASVLLLHVVESGSARMMGGETSDSESRSDKERLEMYATELGELGVEADCDLGFGKPAEELARLVGEHGPDLIVVGSHGHAGMADLVYGTSVERLRHLVTIPVLAVPAPPPNDAEEAQ